MSYIGKEPQTGAYNMLDNLTASATASYSLTLDSTAFVPESANHLLVSLNGVIQKAGSSYTVSGSTLTFSSSLASSDSIDFVLALGNVLDIGTPSDATVTNAKTNFVSTSSAAGLQIKGDGTTDGTLQLNCSQNSHGIKLKSPAHSTSSSYTLTFPGTDPSANKMMQTDGSGNLSFVDAPSGGLAFISSVSQSSNTAAVNMDNVFSATYDSYLLIFDATSNGNGDFIMHFRSSGGSPATQTASNYKYAFNGIDGTDGSNETAIGNNNSQFQVGHGLYNNTQLDYPAIAGFLYFNSPYSSTHTKHFQGTFFTLNSDGTTRGYSGGGAFINQTSLGGVRFSFSSNDVNNLTARMYGLVNS